MRSVAPFYLLGLTLWAACGDDVAEIPDAGGVIQQYELIILDPPGEQIGLAFGQPVDLRVRYQDDEGAPIAGAEVAFALVATGAGEDPAGSALSAPRATTDEAGVARVGVTAGAERTSFRVEVTAPQAPAVTFFVNVANEGFTSIAATPRYVGERPAGDFAIVEVRLYGGETPVPCAGLDPTAAPPSTFPPRTFDGFDETARFYSLAADEGYSILSWGRNAGGQVLAGGCVELQPEQVRAGATIGLEVAVADLPMTPAASYDVESSLGLSPVATMLFAGRTGWGAAACALGAGQLVLDCALDELDGGDPADCVVEGAGALALAIEAARLPVDMLDCRPLDMDSPDAMVHAALEAAAAAFEAQAWALGDLADSVTIRSTLAVAGSSAEHGLVTASVDLGGVPFDVDLAGSSRPVVTASGVPAVWSGDTLSLGAHGFTLRLGEVVRAAFIDLVLGPAGITAPPELLGTALQQSARSGVLDDCAAVSDAACTAAGQASDCLLAACLASRPVLDARLAAPFTRLGHVGLDFVWSGAAAAADADNDLLAESLAGIWLADIYVDDAPVPVTGSWTATAP